MSDLQNLKAAGYMMLSMSLFTLGDAIIKYLSQDLPIGQIVFLRGVIVCGLFVLLLRYQKQSLFPRACWNRWNLLRSVLELLVACFYLVALTLLPLATALILVFSSPIMLTILAALLLKEKVGWRRWCAVSTGFVGVILVADLQQVSLTSWAIVLPLIAAFLTALKDIFMRKVPKVLTATQVSFTIAWVVTLGGLATLPMGWSALKISHLGFLSLGAIFILAAYLCYVITTRIGELSFISPFKYTSIPLAMMIGYLVWGDIPSTTSYIGTAVIVASSVFILFRGATKMPFNAKAERP